MKWMPYRLTPLVNDGYYHVFNRGVEKRDIFLDDADYSRFLQTMHYYQFSGPKPRLSTYKRFRRNDFESHPKIVEIISYCLMPNHFHLILRQIGDNGISEFMSKSTNSYTKFINTKNKRIGSLLQGQFKAEVIETDEHLIQVNRYVHLNPFVAELVKDPEDFFYSSYKEYTGNSTHIVCNTQPILSLFSSKKSYSEFIKDYAGYSKELHKIKHLLID